MKKRHLSILLAVTMLLTALSCVTPAAIAADDPDALVFRSGDLLYTVLTQSGGTGTVEVGGNGEPMFVFGDEIPTSVTIPPTVSYSGVTYTVTAIGDSAFHQGGSEISHITFPDTVKRIGIYSFSNLAAEEITLPSGLLQIDEFAFSSCENLQRIVIPDSVTDIGIYAFRGCTALKSVTLSASLKQIKHYTFSNCTSLLSIDIPGSVSTIRYGAFFSCNSLESVFIHKDVPHIEESAFEFYEESPLVIRSEWGAYARVYAKRNSIPWEEATVSPVYYGTVKLYGSGAAAPQADTPLTLYDCYGEAIKTITTDNTGAFRAELEYEQTKNGVHLQSAQPFGMMLDSGKTALFGKSLYNLSRGDNDLAFLRSGDVTVSGRVTDDKGAAVADADIFYLSSVGKTATNGRFSFTIDQALIRKGARFTVEKSGYVSGEFTVAIDSASLASLGSDGIIDSGSIALVSVRAGDPFADKTVNRLMAMPEYTQRGKQVQVSLYYKSSADIAGASLSVSAPSGITFVPNSCNNTNAVIVDNRLVLNSDIAGNSSHTLTFQVYAATDFNGTEFTLNASVGSGGDSWQIGSSTVTLGDIALDIPGELGISGTDSEAFDLMIAVPASDEFWVGVEVTSPDGTAVETSRELSYLQTEAEGLWITEKNIYIPNVKPGVYTVTAMLMANGIPVAFASKELRVKPSVRRITGISFSSNYSDIIAPAPVTNMSYASANLTMDNNYFGMYPANVNVEFADIADIAEARMTMTTSRGSFPGIVTRNENGFSGTFPAGTYKGSGLGEIVLDITLSDGSEVSFTVSRVTLIIDPSGYVYNNKTGKRVEGATVTLQAMDDKGGWHDWDAKNYAQSNPQTTDAEGRYGWFVPDGKYRVLVSADGYEPYSTQTDPKYGVIEVPPPRDDINIGLVSNLSEPELEIQLLLTSKLLEKCSANIPLKVTGFTTEQPVTLTLTGADGTVYGKATADSSGGALIKASAFPVAGIYTVTAVCGDVSATLELTVSPYDLGIWDVVVSRAADGENTAVTFGETPVPKNGTFDGCVTVKGASVTGISVAGKTVVIPYAFDSLAIGDKIVISGVKYPDLFPSYSFTFTATVK